MLQNDEYALLHLLPGEHTIFVSPAWGLYRGDVANSKGMTAVAWGFNWQRTSSEQREAVQAEIPGWLLRFVAEPGRRYRLDTDTATAWADVREGTTAGRRFDLEVVVVEGDTLTLERPAGWDGWAPCVRVFEREEEPKRVSEILSGVSGRGG